MGDEAWAREVAERLGGIEAKLDGIVTRLGDGRAMHINHGERISALERWRAYILGVLAVITLGVLAVFKLG